MWLEKIVGGSLLKRLLDSVLGPTARESSRFLRRLLHLKIQDDYRGENDLATFRHFLNRLVSVSVGRKRELEEALALLCETQKSNTILVEGMSGYGKTTFFAQLKSELEKRNHRIAWHIFSRSFYQDRDDDPRRFDNNISEQLAWHTGRSIQDIRNRSSFVIENLEHPPRDLIVLLDALDETDAGFLTSRLPPEFLRGAKLLVTARTTGNDDHIEAAGLRREKFDSVISMPPLSKDEIDQLMNLMNVEETSSVTSNEILQISKGDPFFARFLIEDMADGRIQDVLDRRPPSLDRYLQDQFDQLYDPATEIQGKILTQIVISPLPIPQEELIGTIDGLRKSNFRKLFQPIARFFVETDRGYIVCHNRFQEFFAEQLA